MDISEILDNYPAIIIVVVYVVIYGLKKWADMKSPNSEEEDEDSKKAIDSAVRKIARRRAELNESRRVQESKANAESMNVEPLGRLERREFSERTKQEGKRHDREAIPNAEERNSTAPRMEKRNLSAPARKPAPRMEKPWSPFGETTYEFEQWSEDNEPNKPSKPQNTFVDAYSDESSDLKSIYEVFANGYTGNVAAATPAAKRACDSKKLALPRGEMRRAVVMSEILSKPVSLRERGCGGIKI